MQSSKPSCSSPLVVPSSNLNVSPDYFQGDRSWLLELLLPLQEDEPQRTPRMGAPTRLTWVQAPACVRELVVLALQRTLHILFKSYKHSHLLPLLTAHSHVTGALPSRTVSMPRTFLSSSVGDCWGKHSRGYELQVDGLFQFLPALSWEHLSSLTVFLCYWDLFPIDITNLTEREQQNKESLLLLLLLKKLNNYVFLLF